MSKNNDFTSSVIYTTKKVFLIFFCITVVGLISGCVYVFTNLSPVDDDSKEKVEFIVEPGSTRNGILEKLEKEGLIKSALILKIYLKFNDADNFMAGKYYLSKDMDADTIVEYLSTGKNTVDDSITVTFVEGKKVPYYAKIISENFNVSEEEVISKCSDASFLEALMNDYWFITDDILNEKIYYPLEGYIFPDTYSFKPDSSIEDVIRKMLDGMNSKLLPYKDKIQSSGSSIHSLLTMASMVELEAVTAEDRLVLAGLFGNRIQAGWTLGSDVTTYYAARKEMTESLTMSDLNDCNAYNTRGTCVSGLPIGPICSPSESSIIAAITPESTKYYYFVADTHNKLYFGVNESEHNKNISDLKRLGLWPE